MPGRPTISRRRVLGGLAAGAGAALAGGFASALAQTEGGAKPGCPNACRSMIAAGDAWIRGLPIIDAHCHIFNGRDIPAARFIANVFVPNYAVRLSADNRSELEKEINERLAGTLASTPGYEQERAMLEARLAGEPEAAALASAPELPDFAHGGPDACFGTDVAHNIAAMQNLVSLLSRFRHKIFEALMASYASDIPHVGVALFTPALVDMDYWLGPTREQSEAVPDVGVDAFSLPQTTVAQQVELMEMIQRLYPGRVHNFVSFCPWRQADDVYHNALLAPDSPRRRTTALEIVEAAVLNRGFVGVKLYPPMGFRPFGNAEIPLEGFPVWAASTPYSGQFGRALDQALLALYRFCAEHDVPIMAHTAPTNGAGTFTRPDGTSEYYAERADPAYWARALAQPGLSGLRLNLAHFGGGRDAVRASRWRAAIGDLMDAYPHVYTDLSHYAEMVRDDFTGSGQHCQEAASVLEPLRESFLAGGTGANRVRRFLYGSDWSMLAKEFYYADYLAVGAHMYRRKIYGIGRGAEANARGFMCANAVRFLGLGQGDKARTRLGVWYARHGLDASHLARFDEVGA